MRFSIGLAGNLDRIAYSVLRRVGIADRSLLFCCDTETLARVPLHLPDRFEFIELPLQTSRTLIDCNPNFDWATFQNVSSDRFRCFAMRDEEGTKAYAWTGTGEIPPPHNSNGHKWTGLPIYLDGETAYLFAAFVTPSSRGQRLYSSLISHIASTLQQDGIRRISLTTDLGNSPAIKAIQRMGFTFCGETRFTAIAGWKRVSYKVDPSFLPCRFGKYVAEA
jgi:RimJ/RimL family protein N-acetyltransferase